MDCRTALAPWAEVCATQVPGLELFDAHTHLGQNDPDGMKQTPRRAAGRRSASAGARGAFVFPMHEPDGYRDRQRHGDRRGAGRRRRAAHPVLPGEPPRPRRSAEAERSLAAGAKGIKLHPRAEQFTLDHPARARAGRARQRALAADADPRRPRDPRTRCCTPWSSPSEFPDARLHPRPRRRSCDLSWIWRVAADHPNLLFDTAWWMPADMQALFSLVPPGQILFASRRAVRQHRDLGRVPAAVAHSQPGSRPSRSARSPPSSRFGSPPASPCSRPGRRSASASGAPHVLLDRVA